MIVPTRAVAVAATVAAATLWGTSFAVNDAGLHVMDPFTLVFLRFVIGAAVVLAVAAATGGAEPWLVRRKELWILGGLNAMGFLAQSVGQCWTTPARTALFVNSNVFLVAALSAWLLRERFGRGKALAVGGAFLGVVLLSFQQGQPGACGAAWWGDAIIFLGAIAWAFYIIHNRRVLTGIGGRVTSIVGWSFVTTAAWLAPFLLLADRPLHVPIPEGWPVLYAGLVTTAATYFLWSWGLKSVSATASAVIILGEVLIAVAITLALGRETFTPLSIAGGAVLFASIAYVSVAQSKEETPVDARD